MLLRKQSLKKKYCPLFERKVSTIIMWNSSCNMLTMNSGVIVTQLHFIK